MQIQNDNLANAAVLAVDAPRRIQTPVPYGTPVY